MLSRRVRVPRVRSALADRAIGFLVFSQEAAESIVKKDVQVCQRGGFRYRSGRRTHSSRVALCADEADSCCAGVLAKGLQRINTRISGPAEWLAVAVRDLRRCPSADCSHTRVNTG